ncbi:hypothetical protein LEP1GSC125_0953 [Leptospira mayottensis 200901122]|uniref:Uncharacterized protein n=1 Tax=Leptospira mayottensis 200901122 TaxID=1193010 RepID=A0AA87MQU7_9LEPT|nr:hypothetical protein LEP1GSC125_0953 [Leptospira mayottensis 200901122]
MPYILNFEMETFLDKSFLRDSSFGAQMLESPLFDSMS